MCTVYAPACQSLSRRSSAPPYRYINRDLIYTSASPLRCAPFGAQYDPHYPTVGLDELTMDNTDFLRTHKDRPAEDVCAEFRRRNSTDSSSKAALFDRGNCKDVATPIEKGISPRPTNISGRKTGLRSSSSSRTNMSRE
ncbi:putative DNA polymerase kappa [Leishmania braziliensis MHOM/BR/75/M2904]|uniref:DNA polymerase kappa n=1 Tax=Leishmania braziliensis TaxID=5660 RepID=A4HGJ5_LEIBR|nr:putative DNA polymerase kappa [Leishmania braziliensis MHOM/BR/75/M2904]KAI5685786.1 hypothetical protein MNV84_05281 [Leishmania braziliensis]CAJ2475863.1 unnamed protein product [Leishmania braziliensis]CAJ2476325.1 unnamed protein product [Leishmania braziliensis]CAM39689.1 putative DNA polymerase kappa [Leishmania braziliensis MHOM/BR/75/M2904]